MNVRDWSTGETATRRLVYWDSIMAWALVLALLLMVIIAISGGEIRTLGYPAIKRVRLDTVKKAVFLIDPRLTVTKPGLLVGWHTYISHTRKSHRFHLQIWRPGRLGDEQPEYKLVGQTFIHSDQTGYRHFTLHPKDRISVRPGDTLGLFFLKFCPVPWTSVPCTGNNRQLFVYNPRHVDLGRTFAFMNSQLDWEPCRHYSLNATILDEKDLPRYDILHSDELSRDYGKVYRLQQNSVTLHMYRLELVIVSVLVGLLSRAVISHTL